MCKYFLAVCTFFWKKLVHSMAKHFQTPVNKLNSNTNPIPKKHRGPRVWDPWIEGWSRKGYCFVGLHWSISLAYTWKAWLSWTVLMQLSESEGAIAPNLPPLVTHLIAALTNLGITICDSYIEQVWPPLLYRIKPRTSRSSGASKLCYAWSQLPLYDQFDKIHQKFIS